MGEETTAAEPTWPEVFHTLTDSWFRLETLQIYNVDSERDKYQEFLRTGQVQSPGSDDWRAVIAGHKAEGRSLRRVHVVEEPLTDYLRFEIAAYVGNHAAGEDILLLPVARGQWPEGLPRGTDFWLFDDGLPSCTAWAMNYDDGGGFHGAELVRDPGTIETYRRWRDTALAAAVPLNDYLRREV
ncbi:hypothetical protein G5C66_23845 [Nocardioides sp. KC13]|uniref:DUF6879 domain-containing protein n=1 Tax=Nocardioides turkmenicus TaxID=2711220 RepID=A0A6M1RHT5_9ACTN|nr:DUF6879 family protein [Nocardioides sp. KC13]NGN95757.1 hypothetical protein [Nocardioides sp. KC13]